MQIGFIGAGVIASALIRGMVARRAMRGDAIGIYDVDMEKAAALGAELGLTVHDSAERLAQSSDVVFLAVKPHVVAGALAGVNEALRSKRPLIVSVAAGKTLAFLRDALGFDAPICRATPNTNAAVGESMTIVCYNEFVTDAQKTVARQCFDAAGRTHEAPEAQMQALSALCGCSPAYTYLYVDALAKAAHKAGVDKQTATKLAAQAVLGSAKMILDSGEHPARLADNVCSPGGTTIEGVCKLDELGFARAATAAVDAAIEKGERL